MFIYSFIIGNIVFAVLTIVFVIIRKTLGNKISPKYNRLMWIILFLTMTLPLFPKISVMSIYTSSVDGKFNTATANAVISDVTGKEFYIAVNKNNFPFIIWIIGLTVNLIVLLFSRIFLKRFTKYRQDNPYFQKLCDEIGIKAYLFESDEIASPISFGVIKKYVVMPTFQISNEDKSNILLHELFHHKHKDILINYIACIIKSLYWFNPFVYIAFDYLRLDMEMYCDSCVIAYTGNSKGYGKTLLNIVESKTAMPADCNFLGKKQLKKRLTGIANYGKTKSKLPITVTGLVIIPVICIAMITINTFGYSIDYTAKNINSADINLSEYFGNYTGTFVLCDTNADSYIIYNNYLAFKRSAPYSTYKISIALNGLENGVISPENNNMTWNGEKQPFSEWNKNQNLNSAMMYSVNWYFQNIDSKTGGRNIQNFLHHTNYGNKSIGFDIKNYWLNGTLKISPVEQVEFLNNLVNNKYGFEKENINTVFDSIKITDELYGKTGTGMVNGKISDGWFVGFVEINENTYTFALHIEGGENPDGSVAKEITLRILDNLFTTTNTLHIQN